MYLHSSKNTSKNTELINNADSQIQWEPSFGIPSS